MKSSVILGVMVFLSLAGVSKLVLQHHALKDLLDEKGIQCEDRLLDLANLYEAEFDGLRTRLARSASLTSNNNVEVAPEEVENSFSYVAYADEKPVLERFDESLEDIVARKYRFLFSYMNLNESDRETLRQLLMERESVALKLSDARRYGDESGVSSMDIWDLEYALAELDEGIEEFLKGEHAERFALLKNSEEEQEQFNQYTLGVNGLFPLNSDQQEVVLFSRLRHKQNFEQSLEASGLDQDFPLNKAQQDALLAKVEMAAQRYKHSFLQEVRDDLDHDNFPMDQYTMLENYTNTEFQKLMDTLRTKIEERGVLTD